MIPLSIPHLCGNEWKYIKECLDTNWVSSVGSYVDLFEDKFSKFVEVNESIVTVNGTSALQLALKVLKVGDGHEVIVPSLTFISPVNAIRYTGATPVFCDVCRDTYVMDADKLEELINEKTKAILPVHIYGHPVDMDKVMNIAEKYKLFVIEDATESLGSLYKGKHTGTIGHIGCFSFNGNKLITTGAGGMLVTKDEDLGKRAKYLSNQAKTVIENGAFYHEEAGYNFRMPNITAAMGVAHLENLEMFIEKKIAHAKLYNELLKNTPGIRQPVEKSWAKNVNWLYSVIIKEEYGESRDQLIKRLKENGIESRPFFLPVHSMPPYKTCKHGSMTVTEELYQKGLNLPSSISLKNEEIEKICNVIKRS